MSKNVSPPRKVAQDFSPTPRTKRLGPIPALNDKPPVGTSCLWCKSKCCL